MRIHLIKKQTLEDFVRQYSTSKIPLEDWIEKINYADWEEPLDIKNTFNTADILGQGSNRVVFDIGGNNYRMICKYAFGIKQVHLFAGWEHIQIMIKSVLNDYSIRSIGIRYEK